MIYDILAYNYPTLVERIAHLNRRAAKLGCQPMTLRIEREYERETVDDMTGLKYTCRRMEIELEGETPQLNGWSLVAAVERLPDTGENLVRCVPGQSVPEEYRTTNFFCEHCGTQRRRAAIFVLHHEQEGYRQVGRQCIADFLGHVSAESLAARAAWSFEADVLCREAEDDRYGTGAQYPACDIDRFLAMVAIVIRRFGWVSIQAARDSYEQTTSTADFAWRLCMDKQDSVKKLIDEYGLRAEPRDAKLAREALEWARNQPTAGVSDYIYNLGAACRQAGVTYRTRGIVASAVSAYQRHLDKEEELKQRRRENFERGHVGEVGKRADFGTVTTVKRLRYFESAYGTRTLVTFEDLRGNWLVWWASREQDVEEGDVVEIRGTVKQHGDYKGTPQTELQRVVITKKPVEVFNNAEVA